MSKARVEDPAQVQRLVDELRYEPERGLLYWTLRKASRSTRYPAGCLTGSGYLAIKFEGLMFQVHRVVWYMHHGEMPADGLELDHIDGNKSNNRIDNLRLATRSQNGMNVAVRAASGLKGVWFDEKQGKWRSSIKKGGYTTNLGSYNTKEEAWNARLLAEQTHFGEFRR